ncbi:hypothetical protein ROZALSC1DRAFT_22017, partial [Rozella allomycis CSF55]
MSSLSKQLETLRSLNRRLFDADAPVSLEQTLSRALRVLSRQPTLSKYQSTLFSESHLGVDRGHMQTSEESAKFDQELRKFLQDASSLWMRDGMMDVYAWLCDKWRVHRMLVDELLMSVMWMHETFVFARICVKVPVEEHERWRFLEGYKRKWSKVVKSGEEGEGFGREMLVDRMKSDRDVGLRLFEYGCCVGGRVFVFGVCLLVEWMQGLKVFNDENVVLVLKAVNAAMKSGDEGVRVGGMMLVCQLSSNVKLSEQVVEALMVEIVKGNGKTIDEELYALCVLFETQDLKNIPVEVLNKMSLVDGIEMKMKEFVDRYEIQKF